MNTVIFKTENDEFKSIKKEVKERQIYKTTDYDPYEITLLLELISADNYEIILNPEDHYYFEYVSLNLISAGMGTVTCKIYGKIYDAGELKK